MAAIEVRHLHHVYGAAGRNAAAVDDVSFEVEDNQFFTLLGPSGCGKTTTLRCIAGLERPESGEIRLGGTVVVSNRTFVPTHRRDIGMVFQDYAVWPHMTVFDNVAFPLRMRRAGRPRGTELRERVMNMLELMNMAKYEKRRATQLSGGQQQRLSLARALVREPEVLLLDEPLSSLDARLRAQMRGELRRIQRSLKVTTVFVTHDQVEALSLSNEIAVMSDGNIVQQGKPRDIYFRPKTEFVGTFVGSASVLAGEVREIGEPSDDGLIPGLLDTELGPLSCADVGDLPIGASCSVLIRPESPILHDTRPAEGANIYEGNVAVGLFVGEAVDHEIEIGSVTLHVRVPAGERFRRRDKVFLEVPAEQCVVFPQ